jgi:O-antigen/teichoic acid export membrane protein
MGKLVGRRNQLLRSFGTSRPALLLVAGRSAGLVASFAIPVVLARTFDPGTFGTYKQLFLICTTLYGVGQIGAAESLYYFVPRRSDEAGRRVANALATLALMGAVCGAVLYLTRTPIAAWLSNPDVARHLPVVGVFLAFTLATAAFEIVMVSRNQHWSAAGTYAVSDLVRTVLFVVPALRIGTLRALLVGAAGFAALRFGAMLTYLWREFGTELKLDAALWRNQIAYALPFALAVGIDVVLASFHQWAVASSFDAATFAIYAVGCLQIPFVDVVYGSTANVMMVKMAELSGDEKRSALSLWHDTTARLALLIFPVAAFFVLNAHEVIAVLFTGRYLASVPIFRVWCLMILPSAFAVDAVLRAYGQTRLLLVLNVVRLAVIAGLIGWFMSTFGLIGAVLVSLVATSLAKAMAVVTIARLMHVGLADVLPWRRLGAAAVHAAVPVVPAWWATRASVSLLTALTFSAAVYGTTFAALWQLRLAWERAADRANVARGPSACAGEEA